MQNFYKELLIKLFIVFIVMFFNNLCYSQCGKERWDVKTLIDKDTIKIDFENTVSSTVSEQCELKRPKKV
jgi:hypothetical protein